VLLECEVWCEKDTKHMHRVADFHGVRSEREIKRGEKEEQTTA